jgi:hypothetical protein
MDGWFKWTLKSIGIVVRFGTKKKMVDCNMEYLVKEGDVWE